MIFLDFQDVLRDLVRLIQFYVALRTDGYLMSSFQRRVILRAKYFHSEAQTLQLEIDGSLLFKPPN